MNNENFLREIPLVSIIVVTYNSSKYVLETLESAKAQTYSNIELVITDDCSTDNTVSVCETWLKENKSYFGRTKLITVEKNTGIPGNCNRGLKEAKGKWIKLIAGDDLLEFDCTEKNIDFIKTVSTNVALTVSYYSRFVIENQLKKVIGEFGFSEFTVNSINNSSKKQKKNNLAKGNYNFPGCLFFFHREKIIDVGGFDLEFKRIEDLPLLFRILDKYDFLVMPIKTVLYRFEQNSVTSNISREYLNDLNLLYKKYSFKELSYFDIFSYWDIFIKGLVNRLKILNVLRFNLNFLMLLSPKFILNRLTSRN